MTNKTVHNGPPVVSAADQFDGDALVFDGNAHTTGQTPSVTFTGTNTLSSIAETGTSTLPGYSVINLMPGVALTTGGLTLKAANLAITERPGASMTFNGISQVTGGSTLTATGYAGSLTVNGMMTIDGSSAVTMDYVAINGTGTIHLTGESALFRAGVVGANETVVLDGGTLSLTNGMTFLGTIRDSAPGASRIGPIASVAIYNALSAVQETFNRSTGVLKLLDMQGATVASLKFAGTGDLYATPTSGLATNYIAISAHPSAGALPFTVMT